MMVIYCYLFWTGSPQRSNLWNSWWCTCSDLLQNWQRRKDLCQEASYWWQCWHRTLHCKSYRGIIMIWAFHKYQLSNIKSRKFNCNHSLNPSNIHTLSNFLRNELLSTTIIIERLVKFTCRLSSLFSGICTSQW